MNWLISVLLLTDCAELIWRSSNKLPQRHWNIFLLKFDTDWYWYIWFYKVKNHANELWRLKWTFTFFYFLFLHFKLVFVCLGQFYIFLTWTFKGVDLLTLQTEDFLSSVKLCWAPTMTVKSHQTVVYYSPSLQNSCDALNDKQICWILFMFII